jgi:hypothetical protein
MKLVASRDQRTLLSIINSTVIAGSIIFSDEWAGYRTVSQTYLHETVCHKYNFVSPITGFIRRTSSRIRTNKKIG